MIDTHCHLNRCHDIAGVVQRAQDSGIQSLIVPSVMAQDWHPILALAEQYPMVYMAVGLHPMFAHDPDDIHQLQSFLQQHHHHPKLIAIGEIGLDGQQSALSWTQQLQLLQAQLQLAKNYQYPVLLHIRKAQDQVLAQLRRYAIHTGIAHAFSGSLQQAQAYIRQGLYLGLGGACTWERATRLRRLIPQLPHHRIVLETDAPDMPPAWLPHGTANQPAQLPAIATHIATLYGLPRVDLIHHTNHNTVQLFPQLGASVHQ